MQNICEKKIQYLRDIEVWQNLESLCVEEDKRREEISEYKSLSYEYLLLKRYFINCSFMMVELGCNPSFVWRSLLAARDVIKEGFR